MIIPDINILVHAYNSDTREHSAAKAWWAEVLTGSEPVGLAWAVMLGFIRLTTRRGIAARPYSVQSAVSTVREWLDAPGVEILIPGEDHGAILFRLLERLGTGGNLTTDAHLAALAIEYKARIASTDYDFERFSNLHLGLRWFNPIAADRSG